MFTSYTAAQVPGRSIQRMEPDAAGEVRFLVEDDNCVTKPGISCAHRASRQSHRRATISGDQDADDVCVDSPRGLRERRFGATRSRRLASSFVELAYPKEALRKRVQGTVILAVKIDARLGDRRSTLAGPPCFSIDLTTTASGPLPRRRSAAGLPVRFRVHAPSAGQRACSACGPTTVALRHRRRAPAVDRPHRGSN